MLRLLFVFFASFGLSYLSLWGSSGEASPIFNNVNAVLFVLGTLFGALTLAFFNYVEGIMKDVPKKLKLQKPQAYADVVIALTGLKGEVVGNFILVVALLVVAYIVGAVGEMPFIQRLELSMLWEWGCLSVRGACLISVLVVMLSQLSGFLTANDLRAEISMYGE